MILTRRNERIELLRNVPLFSGLSDRHLRAIARHTDEVTVKEGKVLARQGETGREFLVIVDGSARVERDGTTISRLGSGTFFGEMSLIDGQPRTASVVAETPVTLLVIPVRAFANLLDTVPGLQKKILVTLCQRLREADAAIAARN